MILKCNFGYVELEGNSHLIFVAKLLLKFKGNVLQVVNCIAGTKVRQLKMANTDDYR